MKVKATSRYVYNVLDYEADVNYHEEPWNLWGDSPFVGYNTMVCNDVIIWARYEDNVEWLTSDGLPAADRFCLNDGQCSGEHHLAAVLYAKMFSFFGREIRFPESFDYQEVESYFGDRYIKSRTQDDVIGNHVEHLLVVDSFEVAPGFGDSISPDAMIRFYSRDVANLDVYSTVLRESHPHTPYHSMGVMFGD